MTCSNQLDNTSASRLVRCASLKETAKAHRITEAEIGRAVGKTQAAISYLLNKGLGSENLLVRVETALACMVARMLVTSLSTIKNSSTTISGFGATFASVSNQEADKLNGREAL